MKLHPVIPVNVPVDKFATLTISAATSGAEGLKEIEGFKLELGSTELLGFALIDGDSDGDSEGIEDGSELG